MSDDLRKRVDFGIIRYANCWEDADILLSGLAPKPGSRILSVGSAGDNSLSLLATHPELVVAVDVSKTQLYLIELKAACFRNLTREQTLSFLGFQPSQNRIGTFRSLKSALSAGAAEYWQQNLVLIQNGVIYSGKFEKYFLLFSGRILPFIHSRKTVDELFREKEQLEQETFYRQTWNSFRWRMLFRLFFSRYVMGKLGRDPQFLNEVGVSVSQYIYGKASRQLQSQKAQHNYILHFTLQGHYGAFLPHYLREENYKSIQANIERLRIREGFAQDAIGDYEKFDCMNLSDIFEYMGKDQFRETAKTLLDGTRTGGRLVYWNLMVPRRISGILPEVAEYMKPESTALSASDKGFFYNQFIIDKAL